MTEISIKKGETIKVTVETLENYPMDLTYEDAFAFTINKISADFNNTQRLAAEAKARAAAMQNTNPPSSGVAAAANAA